MRSTRVPREAGYVGHACSQFDRGSEKGSQETNNQRFSKPQTNKEGDKMTSWCLSTACFPPRAHHQDAISRRFNEIAMALVDLQPTASTALTEAASCLYQALLENHRIPPLLHLSACPVWASQSSAPFSRTATVTTPTRSLHSWHLQQGQQQRRGAFLTVGLYFFFLWLA